MLPKPLRTRKGPNIPWIAPEMPYTLNPSGTSLRLLEMPGNRTERPWNSRDVHEAPLKSIQTSWNSLRYSWNGSEAARMVWKRPLNAPWSALESPRRHTLKLIGNPSGISQDILRYAPQTILRSIKHRESQSSEEKRAPAHGKLSEHYTFDCTNLPRSSWFGCLVAESTAGKEFQVAFYPWFQVNLRGWVQTSLVRNKMRDHK